MLEELNTGETATVSGNKRSSYKTSEGVWRSVRCCQMRQPEPTLILSCFGTGPFPLPSPKPGKTLMTGISLVLF